MAGKIPNSRTLLHQLMNACFVDFTVCEECASPCGQLGPDHEFWIARLSTQNVLYIAVPHGCLNGPFRQSITSITPSCDLRGWGPECFSRIESCLLRNIKTNCPRLRLLNESFHLLLVRRGEHPIRFPKSFQQVTRLLNGANPFRRVTRFPRRTHS